MHVRGWIVGPAALLAVACGGGAAEPDGAREGEAALLDGRAAEADATVPPPLEVPADAPVVVFLGDSIAAGLHLPEHQAFPAVVQRRLAERGLAFHLICSCESGRTSAGGVGALAWTLRAEPDVVVLQLGGNDGLRGIALEETERNLRTTIERSQAAGARVLLLGVRLPPNYGELAAGFDELYPRLAAEYGIPFVPYWMEGVGGVPERNLPDGLHPTPEGHERLADNVEPALRELLAEIAGQPAE